MAVKSETSAERISEITSCNICYETVQDAVLCPKCSKPFCREHIASWLRDGNKTCPCCRTNVKGIDDFVKCYWIQELLPLFEQLNQPAQQREQHQQSPISQQNTEFGNRAEATFQLCIRDFSKFRESKESRLSSEPCIVRNLPWKILAMSKQLFNKEFVLGFFLQCNAESNSNRWSIAATAELRLLHTTDPKKNVVKKIQHLFYLKENDWGFSPFLYMKEICDPVKGFYDTEKDCITLEVWVKANEPQEMYASDFPLELNEADLYMQVNVLLEKEFFDNYGKADLFDPKKATLYYKTFKVKKSSTLLELYKLISESLWLNVEDMRIWSVLSRYNGTVRPHTHYDVRNSELAHRTLPEISKQDSMWTVFVEQSIDYSFALQFGYERELMKRPAVAIDSQNYVPLPPLTPTQLTAAKLPPFKSDDEVMIFFKFYDPKTSTMRYVFRMYLCKNWTLNMVQERINKKMKFPLQTDLLFFEEVKITHVTLLTLKDSPLSKFAHEQLLNGDIYVFQINEEKLQMYKLPTAMEYYKDLILQVEVAFCDKNQPNDEGVTLQLSLKMKYDEFARRLGAELKYDHEKLQFFRSNPNAKPERHERRPFRVIWISANLKTERELCPMPFKKGNVKELLNETRSDLLKESLITREQYEDEANFRLRLVEIVGSRVHRIFRDDLLIKTLDNAQISTNKHCRVEQILPEEQSLVNGVDYLLPIAHFCKEIYATFGAPFLLKVKLGEPFKDIKARIQKRLDVSDKDFATYRFALISIGLPNYLPEDDDYKFDLSNLSGIQPWLGIDHKNMKYIGF